MSPPFDFWTFEDPQERDERRALDFERQAQKASNEANAQLFERDAGNILSNLWQSAAESFAATAQDWQQGIASTGQEAADAFGQFASERLGQARGGLEGYQDVAPAPEPATFLQPISTGLDDTRKQRQAEAEGIPTPSPLLPDGPAEPGPNRVDDLLYRASGEDLLQPVDERGRAFAPAPALERPAQPQNIGVEDLPSRDPENGAVSVASLSPPGAEPPPPEAGGSSPLTGLADTLRQALAGLQQPGQKYSDPFGSVANVGEGETVPAPGDRAADAIKRGVERTHKDSPIPKSGDPTYVPGLSDVNRVGFGLVGGGYAQNIAQELGKEAGIGTAQTPLGEMGPTDLLQVPGVVAGGAKALPKVAGPAALKGAERVLGRGVERDAAGKVIAEAPNLAERGLSKAGAVLGDLAKAGGRGLSGPKQGIVDDTMGGMEGAMPKRPLRQFEDVVQAVENHPSTRAVLEAVGRDDFSVERPPDMPQLYVRYGTRDPVREGASQNYQTGETLGGLSANELTPPTWFPVNGRTVADYVRQQIRDYSYMRYQGNKGTAAWVFEGELVGRGPDNEPLVKPLRTLGKLTDDVVEATKHEGGPAPPSPLRAEAERLSQGMPEGRGSVSGAQGIVDETEASTRMYHGTGSAFDRPTADKFDPNGLFGPGYYLTSDARVAGSYAEARSANPPVSSAEATQIARQARGLSEEYGGAIRIDTAQLTGRGRQEAIWNLSHQLQQQGFDIDQADDLAGQLIRTRTPAGHNIRPVDVPRGLRLLDIESSTDPRAKIARDLFASFGHAGRADEKAAINQQLAEMGYDGIRYSGGKRIPMADDAGAPIEHEAVVVFPESLDKLRNALSGTPGGLVEGTGSRLAARAGQGAVYGGGAAGYEESQREGATPGSIAKAAGAGALGGAARGVVGGKGMPETLVRQAVRSYGPATQAVDNSMTAPSVPSVSLGQAVRNLQTEVVRKGFDVGVDLRRMSPDAYRTWRLSKGSDPKADLLYRQAIEPVVKGLDEQGLADLNRLLRAKDAIDKAQAVAAPYRTPKRQAVVLASRKFGGMTMADAQAAVREIEQARGPQAFADLEQRAQGVWQGLRKNLLDLSEQSGLIDATTKQDLETKFPHYSPIQVIEWLEDKSSREGLGSGSSRISVSESGIKKLSVEGTERASELPLDAYERVTHAVVARAAKNQAGRELLGDLLQSPQLQALVKPANLEAAQKLGVPVSRQHTLPHRAPGEVGFHVWEQGKRLDFWMDASLESAFSFQAWRPGNPLTKLALGVPASVLRAGATGWNALFLLRNLTRDGIQYLAQGGGIETVPANLGKLAEGYKGAITKDPDYEAMVMAGGKVLGGYFDRKPGEIGTTARELTGVIKDNAGLSRYLKDVLTFKPVRAAGDVVETATRLAEFKRAKAGGAGVEDAALAARDVSLDFSRGGEWAMGVNAVIPFFNAQMQGTAQIVRRLQNPKTRPAALAGIMTTVALPAAVLELYNQQDDTYADVPQYAKDQGFIIMDPRGPGPVSPETGRPIPRYQVIPAAGYAPVVITVREALGKLLTGEGRNPAEIAQAMFKSVLPIEPSANAAYDLMPPSMRLLAEQAANYDAFRDRPIVSEGLSRLPEPEQYTAATSETAKTLGKLTGKSPLRIEHAVKGIAAGVGGQALEAGDLALGAAGVDASPSRRIQQLERDLAKTGLAPEKRAELQHALEVEQTREQARTTSLREQPVVGGIVGTFHKEQGGELERKAAKQLDERLQQRRGATDALGTEAKRLGVNVGDVQGEVSGARLNRRQAETYRQTALDYREQVGQAVVGSAAYQQADDATKTKLLSGALSRAAQWAAQTVVPDPKREGSEFLSPRLGKDPRKATAGYLRALEVQQELEGLRNTRFRGVSAEQLPQIEQDRRLISAYRSAYGELSGDSRARRELGASRFRQAQRARENPSYERRARRLRRDKDYLAFFGPSVIRGEAA